MKENLLFWNPWWKKGFTEETLEVMDRLELARVSSIFERKEILAISGVRRSGKTKLMHLLIRDLLKKTGPGNILYLNFEDESLSGYTLEEIYKTYRAFMKPVGRAYLFLDEIQEVAGWERWVRKMYDSFEDVKITVTGSSGALTKRDYASLFTGRVLNFELYPLSFREFLSFRGFRTGRFSMIEDKEEILEMLREYLKYGAFPEVVMEDDHRKKILLLKSYFETIRDKDVIKRFRLKEVKKFERLTLFLSTNAGKPVSAKGLSGVMRLSTSVVDNYFDLLEVTYLFFFLNHFSFSVKSQVTFPRKCYAIDTGMRNAVSFMFSEDSGRCYENAVFIELKRRQSAEPLAELYYWRGQYGPEVDFVVKSGAKIKELVQVCCDISDPATKKREVKALLRASDELGCGRMTVITENYDTKEKHGGKTVKFIPLWKWLLG